MKRFLSFFLAAVMILSLAACGKKTDEAPNVSVTDVSVNDTGVDDESQDAQEVVLDRVGTNLIENGDFSKDSPAWAIYTNSGAAEFAATAEGGQLSISNTGSLEYAVQLYYDGFELHERGQYEFVFTAWATQDKLCEARIQRNGGDYKAYCIDTVTITTEPQTFTIPFTMDEVKDTQRLAFNCGTNVGESKDDFENLIIWFADVQVNVIDESGAIVLVEEPVTYALFNQLGYTPDAEKLVYFHGSNDVSSYDIYDENGNVVFSGKTTNKKYSSAADEGVRIGDFSDLTTPGTYYIKTANNGKSYTFTISEDVYDDAFSLVVKMLYLQRCGCELTDEYAGDFAHDTCHTEQALIYGTTDQYLEVSGGWHDAGDYGRYIVPAAKTVADLLYAYEENPDAFTDDMGIPESGNGIADILDEARWELEWMLKMQRADGGVYHKVTTEVFCENVSPVNDTEQLYVFDVSTTATGDFAAAMALASEVYKEIDPDFSAVCLEKAELAWDFLDANTIIPFNNPNSVVNTGEYPDATDTDERFWASAVLYRVTGEEKYHDAFKSIANSGTLYHGRGWADVGSYAELEYITLDSEMVDADTYSTIYSDYIKYADSLMAVAKKDSLGISLSSYPWGSNMNVADNGALLYTAYKLTGDETYLSSAFNHMHYIYGANPMGRSYVTGTGTRSPENPHHRMSVVVEAPMAGMLIGGPNEDREDPTAKVYIADGTAPMKCYIDNYDAYSCNEVTIYWNSPLIYLMAVLDK